MTSRFATGAARLVRMPPRPKDGVAAALLGLSVRLAVVVWAAPRFPPVEDGHFYDVVAARIARGLGYTWAWPDGTVTFAAHYPIGYPAFIGALYAVFGAHPAVAMAANAVLGAVAVLAVHRLASTSGSRGAALLAALAIALHPGLVFYTPAIMTEGIAAALLSIAGWIVVRARGARSPWRTAVVLGVLFGITTLVRPQSLLLAPLFGALCACGAPPRARVRLGVFVTALALLVCSPWTLRNCVRLNSCVLVSANAGWNLFIGAAKGATGAWVPIEDLGVPSGCRTVWGEAEKDACFERAGFDEIRRDPIHFLSLVPKKLAVTFDYAGAAGWYLHSSNPGAFSDRRKFLLGAVETLWERWIVLLALSAGAFARGPRPALRRGLGLVSALFLVTRSAWVAHVGLCAVAALFGRKLPERAALAVASVTVFATAATHAVFFGAGRYSLVCFPALSALAGTALTLGNEPGNTEGGKES
jgi:4-amino-4-deoxy-L-arabinose transferase-like glycosyltransferase